MCTIYFISKDSLNFYKVDLIGILQDSLNISKWKILVVCHASNGFDGRQSNRLVSCQDNTQRKTRILGKTDAFYRA